jgi:hypothetical protein
MRISRCELQQAPGQVTADAEARHQALLQEHVHLMSPEARRPGAFQPPLQLPQYPDTGYMDKRTGRTPGGSPSLHPLTCIPRGANGSQHPATVRRAHRGALWPVAHARRREGVVQNFHRQGVICRQGRPVARVALQRDWRKFNRERANRIAPSWLQHHEHSTAAIYRR